MSRVEYLVPEGWRPARNARVQVLPTKDDPVPPSGAWCVIDRSPDGWWLQPADDAARAWAAKVPHRLTSGCISEPGRRLIPPGHKPRPAPTNNRRRTTT